MAGTSHSSGLKPGDRCIIYVDRVNSPQGWWWGLVDTVIWNEDHLGGWAQIEASITGRFDFIPQGFGLSKPAYGCECIKPSVNYIVYDATRDSVDLVQRIVDLTSKCARLNTRLDDLQMVLRPR